MPTASKPKRPTDPYTIPVKILKPDRDLIVECLSADAADKSGQSDAFITSVEQLLSLHFNKMRRALDTPLPTHIVAALIPVERQSKELAALLNPHDLPIDVLRALNVSEVWDGQAWHLLMSIHVHASLAVDQLKKQPSSGIHVQLFGEQLETARKDLAHQFSACRPLQPDDDPKEYEGAKQEFLKICRKYLPKAPTARRSRKTKK
jgi:hypothetical protein